MYFTVQNKKLMNKLILSVITLISFCALFTGCAKTDTTTGPSGPMTATFTKPGKSPVNFIGSHTSAIIAPNAADSTGHIKDSTLTITGHIYIPNTTRDSSLEIDMTIFKYKAGMGGITIDNDTFAYAQLIDTSGHHIANNGQIIFNASTASGATGTFSFTCSDNTTVTSGWFIASWRD